MVKLTYAQVVPVEKLRSRGSDKTNPNKMPRDVEELRLDGELFGGKKKQSEKKDPNGTPKYIEEAQSLLNKIKSERKKQSPRITQAHPPPSPLGLYEKLKKYGDQDLKGIIQDSGKLLRDDIIFLTSDHPKKRPDFMDLLNESKKKDSPENVHLKPQGNTISQRRSPSNLFERLSPLKDEDMSQKLFPHLNTTIIRSPITHHPQRGRISAPVYHTKASPEKDEYQVNSTEVLPHDDGQECPIFETDDSSPELKTPIPKNRVIIDDSPLMGSPPNFDTELENFEMHVNLDSPQILPSENDDLIDDDFIEPKNEQANLAELLRMLKKYPKNIEDQIQETEVLEQQKVRKEVQAEMNMEKQNLETESNGETHQKDDYTDSSENTEAISSENDEVTQIDNEYYGTTMIGSELEIPTHRLPLGDVNYLSNDDFDSPENIERQLRSQQSLEGKEGKLETIEPSGTPETSEVKVKGNIETVEIEELEYVANVQDQTKTETEEVIHETVGELNNLQSNNEQSSIPSTEMDLSFENIKELSKEITLDDLPAESFIGLVDLHKTDFEESLFKDVCELPETVEKNPIQEPISCSCTNPEVEQETLSVSLIDLQEDDAGDGLKNVEISTVLELPSASYNRAVLEQPSSQSATVYESLLEPADNQKYEDSQMCMETQVEELNNYKEQTSEVEKRENQTDYSCETSQSNGTSAGTEHAIEIISPTKSVIEGSNA